MLVVDKNFMFIHYAYQRTLMSTLEITAGFHPQHSSPLTSVLRIVFAESAPCSSTDSRRNLLTEVDFSFLV